MFFRLLVALALLSAGLPARAQLVASPTSFSETVASGEATTRSLALQNTGDAAIRVRLAAAEEAAPRLPFLGTLSRYPVAQPYAGVMGQASVAADAPRPLRASLRRSGSARLFGFNSSSQIIEFDPVTGAERVVANRSEAGGGPEGLAFDGTYLYFQAAFSSQEITKIDAETGEEIAVLFLPEAGNFDALAHDGTLLYALDYVSSVIYVIDYEAGDIIRSFSPGVSAVGGLTYGGSRNTLFVSSGSTVYEIDPEDGQVVASIETTLSGFPYGLGYSNALGTLFAADNSGGRIVAIDPDSGADQYSFDGVFISGLAADEAAGLSWIAFDQTDVTVEPGAEVLVTVTFDATTLLAGTYAANLVLSTDAETLQVPVNLAVTGTPQIEVDPLVLSFDPLFVGATAQNIVRVQNTGTATLTLTATTSTNPDFEVVLDTPERLAPDESREITVAFTPSVVGAASSTLRIESDDPVQPSVELVGAGLGIAPPVVSVSPDRFDEALNTGEVLERTLTVQNTGGSMLTGAVSVRATEDVLRGVEQLRLATPRPRASSAILPRDPAQPRSTMGHQAAGQRATPERIEYQARRAGAPRVLFLGDFLDSFMQTERALASLDVDLTAYFDDYGAFEQDLVGEAWDLVVMDIPNRFYDFSTVITYVEEGGRLLISHWAYDNEPDLVAALGADYRSSISTPESVLAWTSHPIFTSPNFIPDLLPSIDSLPDNGDLFDPIGTTLALAGATPAPTDGVASILLGNEGRTLLNGFLWGDFLGRDDDADGQPDMEELIQNQVLYLIGAQSWLSVTPTTFEVAPGAGASLAVQFDASDLVEDLYEAQIVLATNDPLAAIVSVPVTLDVTGAPVLAVTPEALDFGTLFAGTTAARSITVANVGTAPMTVAGLDVDAASLRLSASAPFTVVPRSDTTVTVTFTPTAPEVLDATIQVRTDAPSTPNADVPVTGTAVAPPVVEVAPAALEETLDIGAQSTQTLTVSNTGGSVLTGTLSIEAVGGLVAARTPHRIRLEGDGGASSRTSNAEALAETPGRERVRLVSARRDAPRVLFFTDDNATVGGLSLVERALAPLEVDALGFLSDYFGFVEALEGESWDVVVVDAPANSYDFTPLIDYVGEGGRLLLSFWDFDSAGDLTQALGAEQRRDIGSPEPVSAWTTHPVFSAPNAVPGLQPTSDRFTDNGDLFEPLVGATALGGATATPAAGEASLILGNEGRTLLNGFLWGDFVSADADGDGQPDIEELVQNQVLYLAGAVNWLSLDPGAVAVEPGAAAEIEVGFDATELVGGAYEARIVLASNDPTTPEVAIPVTLTAVGRPGLALDPGALDFGEVYLDFPATADIVVSNPGTDVLLVESVASSDPALQVAPEPFDVEPGTQVTLSVTYAPEVVGEFTGTLTLTTNLPESERVVDVSASALEAPVLVLDVTNIGAVVPVGETFTAALTLVNGGGSPLDFTIGTSVEGPFSVPNWGDDQEGWNFALRSIQPDPTSGPSVEDQADFHVDGVDFIHAWGTGVRLVEEGDLDATPVPADGYDDGVTAEVGAVYAIQTRDGLYAKIRVESLNTGGGLTFSQVFPVDVAVERQRTPGWLSVTPERGTIAPGASTDVILEFDATNLDLDTYTTRLQVATNDPRSPEVEVTVEMQVVVNPATGDPEALPTEVALHAPYPNPARAATVLAYDLPQATPLEVTLFDIQGRRIATLADRLEPAGRHRLDVDTQGFAAGVYVCRMRAGETVLVQKLHVVR